MHVGVVRRLGHVLAETSSFSRKKVKIVLLSGFIFLRLYFVRFCDVTDNFSYQLDIIYGCTYKDCILLL